MVGKGDVSLLAGNDLKARAATLSADLALALTAGQDIKLTNGENTQDLDERHKVTGSSGWLSKSTTTTRDQIARQTAQARAAGASASPPAPTGAKAASRAAASPTPRPR